jgi:hypothetical protein
MVNGILYSPKYKYMAYYCAKSGCSTLRNFFVEAHKKELPEKEQSEVNVHNAKEYFTLPNNVAVKSLKRFVLVRNPYTRVVSMFMNKFIGTNSHIKRNLREKKIENPVKGESFFSFLKLLQHLKKQNLLNKVDGHVSEQVFNFPSDSDITIMKLENLEEDFVKFYENSFDTKELFQRAQKMFEKDDMHINRTKIKKVSGSNVTHQEFKDEKCASPPYEDFYNTEAKDIVYEIYKEDFKRFEYSSDLPF